MKDQSKLRHHVIKFGKYYYVIFLPVVMILGYITSSNLGYVFLAYGLSVSSFYMLMKIDSIFLSRKKKG